MKKKLKRAIAASVPLALIAGSAMAAGASQIPQTTFHMFGARPAVTNTVVLGGGATLPVPAYLGKSFNGGYQSSGTTTVGVSGSVFGYFASQTGGLNVEYCSTGSGKGKGVFDGPINTVDIPCSNAASGSPATTFGFLPPSGSPRQTFPNLAGTDAPLAQTDYSSYTSNHASPMEPVELPSLYGSIAIYYREDNHTTRITLTDAQLCRIYSTTPVTFNQLLGNGDNTTIVPVYRADGSGTSFNFTNHLQSACKFGVNQTFLSAVNGLPANAVGATGNGGVIAAVKAANGAVGYAEAGYLLPLASGTNYANVVNATTNVAYDPIAGLPAAANTVTSGSLQSNVAVNQTTYNGGPATTSALTGVRSGSCVKVLLPSAYAKPKTGYPIIAVTYLLSNSAGNGSYAAAALRLLEKDLTTPSLFKHPGASAPITTVDEAEPAVSSGTTGYSSLGSTFATVIQSAANSCINV